MLWASKVISICLLVALHLTEGRRNSGDSFIEMKKLCVKWKRNGLNVFTEVKLQNKKGEWECPPGLSTYTVPLPKGLHNMVTKIAEKLNEHEGATQNKRDNPSKPKDKYYQESNKKQQPDKSSSSSDESSDSSNEMFSFNKVVEFLMKLLGSDDK